MFRHDPLRPEYPFNGTIPSVMDYPTVTVSRNHFHSIVLSSPECANGRHAPHSSFRTDRGRRSSVSG